MPTELIDESTLTSVPAPKASRKIHPETKLPALGRAAQSGKISVLTTVVMVIFHIGAIAALFMFSWKALICSVILWVYASNIGIGMCYHRLLTHRGYKVPKWLEYFMTIGATLSLEGGPIFWVATHRVHHQLSDHEGDPHTPTEGAWWAHMGWIVQGVSMHAETAILSRYAPDLSRDKFHVWLSKWHWVPMVVVGFGLLAIGGWSCVMWGIFLRVTLGLHATWLVNSATHMWGSRRFETRDHSRNSWWVALLTGGEGWHNNHHAHPVSARHGLKWYEIDPNYYGIWLLKNLGLAKDVKLAQYDPANPKPAGVA
ncbi:acyl-CoA desaturase [Silvibacterium acidisoli]|uniref:acyl-CoA desaturase n=1 Tax=Acidobacteriaceae bacterium ZG23-2 TaxID=2883246 RepID=UPI00406C6041